MSIVEPAARPSTSTNFDAFSTFIASRRPTFICDSSNGESAPGRPSRPASARRRSRTCRGSPPARRRCPWTSTSSCGRGRATQPEIMRASTGACRARSAPARRVENSQVRMISCAWGRRSIGKTRSNRSGSSSQPPGDLRREGRRRPGVHDVGVADEAARLAALRLVEPVGAVGGRVDRQPVLGGDISSSWSRLARRRRGGTRPGRSRRRSADGRSASRR